MILLIVISFIIYKINKKNIENKNKIKIRDSLIEGEEKERNRIGQELHDGVCSELSAVKMNLELLKAGYPPCVITVESRLAYYEALDQWMAYGETDAFIHLVSDTVLAGFKPYQVVLGL